MIKSTTCATILVLVLSAACWAAPSAKTAGGGLKTTLRQLASGKLEIQCFNITDVPGLVVIHNPKNKWRIRISARTGESLQVVDLPPDSELGDLKIVQKLLEPSFVGAINSNP